MSHKKQTFITIDEYIYDVTKFIASHPGEGIHDMYLRNWHLKNASAEFEQYHNTEEAFNWIETAQKNKYDPETGIFCIGPSYFAKRIPSYFRFYSTEESLESAAKDLLPNTFFLVPKENDLQLVIKDVNSEIHRVDVTVRDKKWKSDTAGYESPASATPENAIDAAVVQRGFDESSSRSLHKDRHKSCTRSRRVIAFLIVIDYVRHRTNSSFAANNGGSRGGGGPKPNSREEKSRARGSIKLLRESGAPQLAFSKQMNSFTRRTVHRLVSPLRVSVWNRIGRASPDLIHSVVFAISNFDNAAATCDSLLRKTSEPSSRFYGQHKSLAEINEMFINREAVGRVEAWLNLQGLSFETTGEYIKVTDSISKLETLLDAQFHAFKRPEAIERLYFKSDFHTIPNEIVNDVQFILNLDLPKIIPRKITRSIASLYDDDYEVTPSLINSYYKISNNTVSMATQAIYEAEGQGFSPEDLSDFQTQFSLPLIPLSTGTGDNSDHACPDDCLESNLDVQYLIAVSQSMETHYNSIDSSSSEPFYDWIIRLSQARQIAQVHSVSYASFENQQSPDMMKRFNLEVCKINLRGVTIVVGSGDDGVIGQTSGCGFNPYFPANSPYVLTVGATVGPESGNPEVTCTDDNGCDFTTGGGFSSTFKRPAYQDSAVLHYLATAPSLPDRSSFASSGRGYPDIAALGSNYAILVQGQIQTISGTSASTPVIAAMISLINERRLQKGKQTLGFVNPAVYEAPASVWNDMTNGRNNCNSDGCCDEGFNATVGWDPLSGLGSPKFDKLSAYLSKL
ncbi:tripeptidyl-peptidase 1-like [Planoprotostelium fungivorum]|uniref:Tripeptidyl-peptidase 1-like n=1 Tax=Planoprotostelium fungivorum TaxID=1890364 RepID=A0A2P6NV73_9EUKA|nr:tripeptidyl-peptidase 1-like [Planoprotostelium fungivorum]